MSYTSYLATIDWVATGAMLQGWGTILGAFAVGAAAWIGRSTFESWRQQKLAERRIDQAERILTATYRVRRALAYVRSPFMMNSELQAAEERLKENGVWNSISINDRDRYRTTQSYYDRLNSTIDARKSLEECQPMAHALFGDRLESAIKELNRQFLVVGLYVDSYRYGWKSSNIDHTDRIERAMYEGYPSPQENEFDKAINSQVKFIEDVCLPVLRLEGRD